LGVALGELGAGVAGSRVRTVRPERLAEAEPARAVIYDRFVPPGPPRAEPALYLEPPAGNPVCPGRRPVDDAAVIDWDVDHPAVAGLDGLEALTLEHAVQLVTPGWGSAVVLGATARGAFPLLVAGGRVVLANLFDDRESDIGRSGGGEWPATARPAATSAAGAARRELGWWLYLAAAALLALEWSAWQARRPRRVA